MNNNLNFKPRYTSSVQRHEQIEYNRLKYEGFSEERNYVYYKMIIEDLKKEMIKMDTHPLGSQLNFHGNILCFSIRPNIGFEKTIVFNTEYNYKAEELRNNEEREKKKMESRARNKLIKERRDLEVVLANKYEVLQNLCDQHNEELKDDLTPEKSVNEILVIRKKCKVEEHLSNKDIDKFLKNLSISDESNKISNLIDDIERVETLNKSLMKQMIKKVNLTNEKVVNLNITTSEPPRSLSVAEVICVDIPEDEKILELKLLGKETSVLREFKIMLTNEYKSTFENKTHSQRKLMIELLNKFYPIKNHFEAYKYLFGIIINFILKFV